MKRQSTLLLFAALSLSSGFVICYPATSISADVYNCDGRWTNKPCRGKILEKLPLDESKRRVLSPELAKARSEKRSLLHELDMAAVEARRRLDVRFSISPAERVCVSDETSLIECEEIVRQLEDQLAIRANEAEQLKIQRDAAATSVDEGATTIISEQQTVILGDEGWQDGRRGDRRGRGDRVEHHRSPPQIDENKIIFRPNGELDKTNNRRPDRHDGKYDGKYGGKRDGKYDSKNRRAGGEVGSAEPHGDGFSNRGVVNSPSPRRGR